MSYQFSKYKVEKLSTYANIEPGYAFKSEKFTQNASDIPLVKGENVQQGFIEWAASKYWPNSDSASYEKYTLKTGDVVLAMDRPWVTAGLKWAYIKPHDPRSLLVQRVARLRSKFGLDQTYLRCLISSSYFSAYIQPIVTGVNVPHISGKQIGDFTIPIPKIEIQRKISAILSAYDDLIENNRRRIQLLEILASEVYQEWFVRRRFPGHESAKFEKGIPKGWDLMRFEDIVAYYIGGGWGEEIASSTFSEGAHVIRGTDVPDFNDGTFEPPYRFHKLSNLKSRILLDGDFVFEVSGGSKDQLLGRNVLLTQKIIDFLGGSVMCASFCKQIRFKTDIVSPLFMKYFMKLFYESELVGLYQIQSTGISNYQFEAFLKFQSIIVPSQAIQIAFDKIVKPMVELKDDLSLKNISLKKTRDLLLPRLISGNLSVESLAIQFPQDMQEAA